MDEPVRVRVSLDQLPLGTTCPYDIHDERGILLLGKGHPLTATIRGQIQDRGVSFVEVHPDDAHALPGPSSPKRSASRRSVRRPSRPSSQSLLRQREDRHREVYSSSRAERFAENVSIACGAIDRVGGEIQSRTRPDMSELCKIPGRMMDMVLEDADQSISAVSDPDEPLSLPQRCTRMSLLAISTGVEMELPENLVAQLGTAALLHDLGLYLMPDHFRDPTIALGADEIWEYRRHPLLLMNALANLSIVSEEVRVIASHVHERRNGSGYPRGLRANLIHPLAHVLSIVDSFLTLIEPGPDRAAVIPHDAIGFLLHEASRGVFDGAAMRAFLNQMALFPIGSQVELDNGQQATVIRRDGNHYATPLVRIDGVPTSDMLPTRESERHIARPVFDRPGRQMRITASMMPEIQMEMFQRAR
jgi:response regulator RpfG family c-di-GMP phosphodiesterase